MMTTIDQERDVHAVQLLLSLATQLEGVEDLEMEELREELLADAWTVLEGVDDHQDAWRLRAITRDAQGIRSDAVDCLRNAVGAGDLTALIRLGSLLEAEGLATEAREVSSRIAAEIKRGNPDVLWAVARDSALGVLEEGESFDELVRRAAAAGSVEAQRMLLEHALREGDVGALEQLRLMGDNSDIALVLASHLWRFAPGDLNDPDLELGEGIRWAKAAHDKGNLQATILLWAKSEPPADAEFEAILNSRFISGERLNHFAFLSTGGRGQQLIALGQMAAEDADQLTALRLLQAAAFAGADGAVGLLGMLLKEEANNAGPWATLGAFLWSWPQSLGMDLVGTPEFPLQVTERKPALRDDHASALAIDDSDFARRILEVFEQVGWRVIPLGDHLLVGHWRVESGPIQIFLEIAGGDDSDQCAYLSTPLLVSVSETPWEAPVSSTDGWEDGEEFVTPEFRRQMTAVNAFTESFEHPQRRALEALFRLGENGSRDYHLEPMGFFGLTLGGLMGRRMTFDGAPVRLYPQAWASTSQSDYCSSPGIEAFPQEHRCSEPIDTMYVGYTLSSKLSGGHLRGIVSGTVHSLMAIQDYVTRMFDDEPTIFHEFFSAVPMTRIHNHRNLFGGAIPNVHREIANTGSRVHRGMEAVKAQRHETILDPDADAVALNNASWQLMNDGFYDEAMSGFDRAASMGQPNALATLLWQYLQVGRIQEAVSAYEEYFPRVQGWMASVAPGIRESVYSQLANCKSNAAIAFVAQGDFDRALQLWSEADRDGHIEAQAYPGVLAYRQGDFAQSRRILKRLARSELAEFREIMEEEATGTSGWFQRWARDAVDAVDQV